MVTLHFEYDNVSLYQGYNESIRTDAHWKLLIIANESDFADIVWEQEILPGSERIGDYAGVVEKTFKIGGSFTLWIILKALYDDQEKVVDCSFRRIDILS